MSPVPLGKELLARSGDFHYISKVFRGISDQLQCWPAIASTVFRIALRRGILSAAVEQLGSNGFILNPSVWSGPRKYVPQRLLLAGGQGHNKAKQTTTQDDGSGNEKPSAHDSPTVLAASTRTLAVGAGVVAVCCRQDQQVSRAVPHQVTSQRGHHMVALRLALGARSHARAETAMYPTLEARCAEIVDIHNLLLDQGSNNALI